MTASAGSGRSADAPSENIQEVFLKAYADYLRALQQAWAPEELNRQVADALNTVLQRSQAVDPRPESHQRVADAYQSYLRVIWRFSDPREVQRRANEGFREYISALKRAFADLDPETIDIGSMEVIGQSILQGAYTSNAALMALGQQWATMAQQPPGAGNGPSGTNDQGASG